MNTTFKTCAAVALTLTLCGLMSPGKSARAAVDKPLALVNNVAITAQDLDHERRRLRAEMEMRNRPLTDREAVTLNDQLLDNLIDRELLYQQAQRIKIQVRSQWVDRALNELKSQLGSTKGYQNYLSDTGLSEPQLKESIRRGLIVRRLLRRQVMRQIKVSEAEMQAFYRRHSEYFERGEQVRARHILIAFRDKQDGTKRQEALLRIQAIQSKLQQGSKFAALALEYSDCPSKSRGGDLGYFERDQMVRAFSDVAFSLKPGQISDIVETRFGFHLIQVLDRRPPAQIAYKNVRAKIERTLRRNKEKKAANTYLARLKQQAAIVRP